MKKGSIRPNPVENQVYRHFKGTLYQIVTIAVHTEDSEKLVVYKSVENPEKVFARPLEMFMSEVDRFRYPMIRAKYRFTLVEDGEEEEAQAQEIEENTETIGVEEPLEAEETAGSEETAEQEEIAEPDGTVESEMPSETVEEITDDNAVYKADGTLVIDPVVEAILDEKDFTKKIENFQLLRNKCTEEMLTTLAISLDVQLSGNTVEEKYAEILKTLKMHEKYETGRLR